MGEHARARACLRSTLEVGMSVALVDPLWDVELPGHWPGALHPEALAAIDRATPFLICDLTTIRSRYLSLTGCLPGIECYYALKCNPAREVLETLADLRSKFEIASAGELALLEPLGLDPADAIY